MARQQFYNFCGISYLSIDQFLSVVQTKDAKGIIRAYALIPHDKDLFTAEDYAKDPLKVPGSPKPYHLHFIIRTFSPFPISTIVNWFDGFFDEKGLHINTLVQKCSSILSSYRYFFHLDNPEKFQYNQDALIVTDANEFSTDTEQDTSFLALEYLLQGHSVYETARVFGRDFIYHYGHLKQIYFDITGLPLGKERTENEGYR